MNPCYDLIGKTFSEALCDEKFRRYLLNSHVIIKLYMLGQGNLFNDYGYFADSHSIKRCMKVEEDGDYFLDYSDKINFDGIVGNIDIEVYNSLFSADSYTEITVELRCAELKNKSVNNPVNDIDTEAISEVPKASASVRDIMRKHKRRK